MSQIKFLIPPDVEDDKHSKGSDNRTESNVDDTIHYLSPASLTATTIQAEDFPSPTFAYLKYLHSAQQLGEYVPVSSISSSISFEEIPNLERTLAIIKPDAVQYEDVVIRRIKQAGLKILQKRKIHLTPEQVSELYASQYGKVSFPYLVVGMSGGPVVVLCLAGVQAVARWRSLVRETGCLHTSWFFPRSVRVRFGVQETLENILHASEDLQSANREIRFFFPQMILEPLLKGHEISDYLQLRVNPTLLNGLTELCRKKPVEPILHFAEWLLVNNPYQPKVKREIAILPT